MTKTTYKVGDKVRILKAKKIQFGERYWNDGDISEIKRLLDDGRPCLSRNTKELDDRGLPLWSTELQYIEKVEESDTKITKFKVGDIVKANEQSNVKYALTTKDNGFTGEVVAVDKTGRLGIRTLTRNDSDLKTVFNDLESKYFELVSPKPTKNQRLTSAEQAISTLEQKVEAMQAEIDALKAAQKLDEVAETFGIKRQHAAPKSTPNEQRKAIIDEAKAFVEAQFTEGNGKYVWGEHGHAKVDFYVNEEKRTVVAKLSNAYCGEWTRIRKAKCNPSDVFNEHIGKAIALGRALGLDVSKFEKAVQPSEVVYGMVVRGVCDCFYSANRTFTINGEHRDSDAFYYEEAKQYGGGDNDWILRNQIGVIVNDSEAKY